MKNYYLASLIIFNCLTLSCNKEKKAINEENRTIQKEIDLHKEAVGREADQASQNTDNNATIDKAQIEARKVSVQAQLDADKKKADAQAEAAKAKVDAQNK